MSLDVRIPIGLLFCIFGVLLAAAGIMTVGRPEATPTGVPIDFVWSGVMFVFGLAMLGLARHAARQKARQPPP